MPTKAQLCVENTKLTKESSDRFKNIQFLNKKLSSADQSFENLKKIYDEAEESNSALRLDLARNNATINSLNSEVQILRDKFTDYSELNWFERIFKSIS